MPYEILLCVASVVISLQNPCEICITSFLSSIRVFILHFGPFRWSQPYSYIGEKGPKIVASTPMSHHNETQPPASCPIPARRPAEPAEGPSGTGKASHPQPARRASQLAGSPFKRAGCQFKWPGQSGGPESEWLGPEQLAGSGELMRDAGSADWLSGIDVILKAEFTREIFGLGGLRFSFECWYIAWRRINKFFVVFS